MICKNEEDRTIIELPYTEENLENYTEELFRKAGIKATVSVVVDKDELIMGGGDIDSNNVNWEVYNKSITIPYRYFYYVAKLITTGKAPEYSEEEKPYGFMDFLKEIPIQGNFFKKGEETPSVSYFEEVKEEEPETQSSPSIFQPTEEPDQPEEEEPTQPAKEEEPSTAISIIPDFIKNTLFKESEKKKIVIEIFKEEEEREEDENLCKLREVKKYKWLSKEKLFKINLIEGDVKYKNTKIEKKEIRDKRLVANRVV